MAKIHQWKFENNLFDSVGTDHGSALGSGVTYPVGIFGKAVQAVDNTSGVDHGTPADLQFTTGPFTFLNWIYVDGTTPLVSYIWSRWNTGDTRYALIYDSSGRLNFYVEGVAQITSSALSAGLYQVACRRGGDGGTTATLYDMFINGVIVGTQSSGPAAIGAGSISFKQINGGGATLSYRNGWVDNLEVWNEALTDAAISSSYFASLNTITMTPIDPVADETGVLVTDKISLDIDDSANVLSLPDTVLTATRGDVVETAYDGSAGGYQTGWSGDTLSVVGSGPSQIEVRNVAPTVGWYENNTISFRVQSENDLGHVLDESYEFVIQQTDYVPNSGFEANDGVAASTQATGWTQQGLAERQKNPTSWSTPPQGDHAMTLFDDLAFPTYGSVSTIYADTTDLTDVVFLNLYERMKAPTIDAGDTIDFYAYVDTTQVYTRQLTSADSGTDDTTAKTISTSGYTGVHEVRVFAVYTKSGEQVFVDILAEEAVFDNQSRTYEETEKWSGTLQVFDDDTATEATFDTGTNPYESTDNWS